MNFALPEVDWNDLGKSITRVCTFTFCNSSREKNRRDECSCVIISLDTNSYT